MSYKIRFFAITTLAVTLAGCGSGSGEVPLIDGLEANDSSQPAVDVRPITPADIYSVVMNCSAIGSAEPLQRRYNLRVEDGRLLSFERGEDGAPGREVWEGSITSDGSVLVEGSYQDIPDAVAEISFQGKVYDGEIILSGNRGKRTCDISGQRVES